MFVLLLLVEKEKYYITYNSISVVLQKTLFKNIILLKY